jgi:hypothetical protein
MKISTTHKLFSRVSYPIVHFQGCAGIIVCMSSRETSQFHISKIFKDLLPTSQMSLGGLEKFLDWIPVLYKYFGWYKYFGYQCNTRRWFFDTS